MKPLAVLLALMFALAALSGCITSRLPAQSITVKKLDIVAQNFTELMSLGIPLQCLVKTGNGTLLVQIKNGTMRAEINGQALVKDRDTLYMQVPQSRKAEFNCDWVMVNESADVFADSLADLDPLKENLDSLPAQDFLCDAAYVKDSDFYPAGRMCWYFDLK
ncbi:Uncharacterised protein [uncultured archaeon]|nr:Uncharacterised protein [uncultured archaeon]